MTNEVNEKLRKRIAALIAKAERTDNTNEAAIFMAKASELLTKHGIDAMSLGEHNDLVGNQFGATWKRNDKYKQTLFFAVANLFYCRGIAQRRHKKDTVGMIIGRESARTTFKYMWPFILKQMAAQAKALHVEGGMGRTEAKRQVSVALTFRIAEIIRERRVWEGDKAQEFALIVVDELKAFTEQAYKNLKPVKGDYRTSRAAMDKAKNVSLNVQVNEDNKQLKIG